MDEKSLDALRNGLEDSYWYGDDDEKVFNELVRKAEAFDRIIEISEECDNYMDFGDEIDAVIRSYKEEMNK